MATIACSLVISCSIGPDYAGTWRGEVLIVSVEYTFTKDTYECSTYSFNNVLVGGFKGRLSVHGKTMSIDEKQKYVYDNATATGAWVPSESSYTMTYSIKGKQITLQPSTSTESFTLERQ
jgi:hypothetical protein